MTSRNPKSHDEEQTQQPISSGDATTKRKTGGGYDDEKIESRGGGDNKKKVKYVKWSNDDHIALLEGISKYVGKRTGAKFYKYITDSVQLGFELSSSQIVDKIYRLRLKYEANVEKKAAGEDLIFTKPYEQKAFKLSKKIWGCSDAAKLPQGHSVGKGKAKSSKPEPKNKVNRGGVKSEVETKVVGGSGHHDGSVKNGFWSNIPPLSSVMDLDKEPTLPVSWKNFTNEMISKGDDKAKELEEKWRVLQEKELELKLQRTDLLKQEHQLELDRMRASRF